MTGRALTSAVTAIAAAAVTVAGAAIGLAQGVTSVRHEQADLTVHPRNIARATLPTRPGSYLGVYTPGVPRSYAPVDKFAAAVGLSPDLVLYYSGWQEGFQSAFAKMATRHGATLLIQMDPSGTSLADIASGRYDAYLASYARAVAAFKHPVVIGFGHEMNGDWYSWGYRHTSPALFVLAWRHVHTAFTAQGAQNVTWLWTITNLSAGRTGSLERWWPGSNYVDWVGIDAYYVYPYDTFESVFGPTISAIQRLTRTPILLAETGAAAGSGKASKLRNLFPNILAHNLLGLVYFDEDQHAHSGYHQNWRLEDSPQAVAEFRRLASGLQLWRATP